MMYQFFRLECLRMLRDARYLALAVIAPIGFYLLFATLFGGSPQPRGQLKGTVEIMVAMAAYGAVWGALSTTGPRIAQERASTWLDQLRTMPLGPARVMAGKLAAAMVVVLPALVLVCVTGWAAKGVSLAAWQWAAVIALMWLGTLPFALLGVALGYLVGPEAAFPLSYGVYMAMSAMGGLWVPPSQLPASFTRVAEALPTYRLADLGWRVADGQAPTLPDMLVLLAWTLGLAVVTALAYRGRGGSGLRRGDGVRVRGRRRGRGRGRARFGEGAEGAA